MKNNFKCLFILLASILFFGCPGSVEDKISLTSIEVTKNSKTEYLVEEEFDSTSIEVTAFYSDESSKVVTDWTYSGFDSSAACETQTITISYTEEEITETTEIVIKIKNNEPKMELYETEGSPIKTSYYSGEELSAYSFKITYSDLSSKIVSLTDCTYTGYSSTEKPCAEAIITFTYTEGDISVSCNLSVEIKECSNVSISPEDGLFSPGDTIKLTCIYSYNNYS